MERLRCSNCSLYFPVEFFSAAQRKRRAGGRCCRLCSRWRGINKRAVGGRYVQHGSASQAHYFKRRIDIDFYWAASPKQFVIDILSMIGPPPGHAWNVFTLDRIDNDRGYVPGNLRWATAREQYANSSRGEGSIWNG